MCSKARSGSNIFTNLVVEHHHRNHQIRPELLLVHQNPLRQKFAHLVVLIQKKERLLLRQKLVLLQVAPN
jgi:hypothetical protein